MNAYREDYLQDQRDRIITERVQREWREAGKVLHTLHDITSEPCAPIARRDDAAEMKAPALHYVAWITPDHTGVSRRVELGLLQSIEEARLLATLEGQKLFGRLKFSTKVGAAA